MLSHKICIHAYKLMCGNLKCFLSCMPLWMIKMIERNFNLFIRVKTSQVQSQLLWNLPREWFGYNYFMPIISLSHIKKSWLSSSPVMGTCAFSTWWWRRLQFCLDTQEKWKRKGNMWCHQWDLFVHAEIWWQFWKHINCELNRQNSVQMFSWACPPTCFYSWKGSIE